MSTDAYDVIVVGGSFAGLAAAIQLGRARRRVLVIDAGRPRNRFARSSHGFLGQDGRSPEEITETFRAQVLAYPTVRFEDGEATDATRVGDDEFAVTLSLGGEVRARLLILATGVADELPPLPGMQERWGVSVVHCPYCHGYEVRDGRLGVLATSETMPHQTLMLLHWSDDVTLFTNGLVELSEDQRAELAGRVTVVEQPIAELLGDAPGMTGVRLEDGGVVELDALFTATRTRMTSPLAERLGCAFDDGPFGPIVRTDMMKETTVPGVFCAGDAARAMQNATFAAADGAMAGVAAHRALVIGGGAP